jgi:homoaconitase/3-isopropylmalate dehydratase large subunit
MVQNKEDYAWKHGISELAKITSEKKFIGSCNNGRLGTVL